MAEKEQRIWLEFDIPKPEGAVEATRCTTMTRSEAIERIKKGLIKGDDFFTGGYDTMAECALNSLLGGKDA